MKKFTKTLDKSDYVMPEVQPAHFTEIQNNLADLHDKLFPDAKHISPDDAQFLRANAKKALKGQKLVSEEDFLKLKEEVEGLRWFRDEVNSRVIPGETDSHDAAREFINGSLKKLKLYESQLDKADELILDIHAQITTYSKYTASKVYEWKDLRGKDGSEELREFDDNGRDEE